MKKDKPSLREKLREKLAGINLDYTLILLGSIGDVLAISIFSALAEILDDALVGPSKMKALDQAITAIENQSHTEPKPAEDYSFNLAEILTSLKNRGFRFFENLALGEVELSKELNVLDLHKRILTSHTRWSSKIDVISPDGHSHPLFELEDFLYLEKYGIPKLDKEFIEEDVLQNLDKMGLLILPKEISSKPLSWSEYLEKGGVVYIKTSKGELMPIKKGEDLWRLAPKFMEKFRKAYLGEPRYLDYSKDGK